MNFPNDTSSRTTPPLHALPPELDLAYRSAVYLVGPVPVGESASAGPVGKRGERLRFSPGVRDPALDCLLEGHGVAHAVFVTAENPRSKRLDSRANAARTAALRRRLRTLGARVVSGESRSATGDWRERSFLVLGFDESAGLRLARELEQSAFVLLSVGEPPKLVAT